MFPATNRPRGPPGNTARLHTDAEKPTVSQQLSKKKKTQNKQTCMCRYTNGSLNARFSSCLNAQFDICIKRRCDVLQNWKTAALMIEIRLGAATQGILKYWSGRWQEINARLITLWSTDYKWWHCFVSFAYHLCHCILFTDRPATVTHHCLSVTWWSPVNCEE